MKQILVIDDEADICEIAKISLQITKQWQVLTVASGQEGVSVATETQPDAILLDVVMPGLDGLHTLKLLKETPATRHIPVIMLTAAGSMVTQRQYAELGAQAVVTKPFDPGLLGNQIANVLSWDIDDHRTDRQAS
ncbi:response regulator [Leptolyngbya sp. AN02str]|uniref:response regulator n=1 Tax=Leptolyngbya sp. AN02str TaxID=3423363 RepID=UPI003D322DA4